MPRPSSTFVRHAALLLTLVPAAAYGQGTPAPAVPVPAASAPAPALADSLTGLAKAEYAAARILYEDGDYQGALQKLKSSFDLSKDPRLLWNMAACEKNLRHYAEVVRLVDRYVAEGGALVSEEDRASATTLLDTVRGFVADVLVEANEVDATIRVDEQIVGKTPLPGPLHIDMGVHRLVVSKAGFVDFVTQQDLPGGQPVRVTATLVVEKHEGRLRVTAAPSDVIQVDGKVVGTGLWEGLLPSGRHAVYVSAKGKRAHQAEAFIQDNDTTALQIALQDESRQTVIVEKGGVPGWIWVTGSALLVGGGVGAYFLLRPHGDQYESPKDGTWGGISL